jgi:uncharacterized protein YciI
VGYFLVERGQGPEWDHARGRREQHGWAEHAAFMDVLVDEGFIVLGGPTGDDVDHGIVLLVVEAESEAALRARFADDPWPADVLTVERVTPWTVWLRPG